jgi:hypothetical protein
MCHNGEFESTECHPICVLEYAEQIQHQLMNMIGKGFEASENN